MMAMPERLRVSQARISDGFLAELLGVSMSDAWFVLLGFRFCSPGPCVCCKKGTYK
jgi:hypothetical protein